MIEPPTIGDTFEESRSLIDTVPAYTNRRTSEDIRQQSLYMYSTKLLTLTHLHTKSTLKNRDCMPSVLGRHVNGTSFHMDASHLIILRDSHNENQALNTFETMNPLLSFTSLTSNIKNTIKQIANMKFNFCYSSRLDSCSNDIFISRNIISSSNSSDFIKEAVFVKGEKVAYSAKLAYSQHVLQFI